MQCKIDAFLLWVVKHISGDYMENYQDEITRICELLSAHPDGMSITEISGILSINRNTVSKYLDILQTRGSVDGRKRGTSKIYYLSERLPAGALKKTCTRPFVIIDQNGKITEANADFGQLIQVRSDQLTQTSALNLPIRFPEDGSLDAILKIGLKGTEQRARAQIMTGGKIQSVTLLLIPSILENGKPGVCLIADTDTFSPTHPHKDELSEETLALLDDGAEYILRRTADGMLRYVNEPYCRAAGKKKEELIGRPFKPLVSPEDAERIRNHLMGLSPQYPVGIIEYKVVMANGELRYQWWQDRALFNTRGERTGINSFGIDVSDRVLTAQKLKKTQETLEDTIVNRTEELREINRQLYSEIAQREQMEEQLLLAQFSMDKATDMVFWISQDAKIRYANDAVIERLQYDKTALMAHPFGAIVPLFSQEEWTGLWAELKKGRSVSRETSLLRKDGTEVPAEVRLTYIEFHGKEFVYCTSRDLSERLRMDRAIKEANRKLNIYTSIARHDIQNKITVLLAYLGRTKKAVTDPVLLDYLDHQEDAAKAIRTEINLTRDFKDMGLKSPEWQNIPQILAGVISRYEHKPLTISANIPDVEIYADGQLEHIFERLVGKFFERHNDNPEICIRYRISDGFLTIIIEDNGPGFSPEEKDQLFELQNDGSGDRDLFMAHEILSLTNITLAETGDPLKGACFEIRIPETYYRFIPELV